VDYQKNEAMNDFGENRNHPPSGVQEVEAKKRPELPSWLMNNIAELSKHTRTVYAVYIGFLIYCGLVALNTPDRKIILDEKARLPLINLDVQFSGFVILSPLIAILIFIDLQIHLQVLKRMINEAELDYEAMKGWLYPWAITMAERSEPGGLGIMQKVIVELSLWWLLPVVLLLFTRFTLKQHDAALGIYEWAISCAGVLVSFWLWRRHDSINRIRLASSNQSAGFEQRLKSAQRVKRWSFGAMIGMFLFLLLIMIPNGNKARTGWFSVDLSNQTLVEKKEDEQGGYFGNLQNKHLDGADFSKSFLKGASFRNSTLDRASYQEAILEGADLYHCSLRQANLISANLKKAKLHLADLSEANLICSVLGVCRLKGSKNYLGLAGSVSSFARV
jgi:pentapeptide repeat protein